MMRLIALTAAVAMSASAHPAASQPAPFEWGGGGKSPDWSDPANWKAGAAPPANTVTNALLLDDGSKRNVTRQDIGNLKLNTLVFGPKGGNGSFGFTVAAPATGGGQIEFDNDGGDPGTDPTLVVNTTKVGSETITAPLYLRNDTTVTGAGTARLVLNNTVTGPSALTFSGPFATQLSGEGKSNSWTGPTTITAGTVELRKTTAPAVAKVTVAVPTDTTITGGKLVSYGSEEISPGATLTVNGGEFFLANSASAAGLRQDFKSLQGTGGVVRLGVFDKEHEAPSNTLVTGGGGAGAPFAGVIAGTGNLVKVGANTLVLSGNSTYTGTTLVKAGTLDVTGSIGTAAAPTGAVRVQNKATLEGRPNIPANPNPNIITTVPVTVDPGGTLKPGNTPGVFTISGGVDLRPGAVFAEEIGTPATGLAMACEAPGCYSRLVVTSGAVGIAGAVLDLTLDDPSRIGEQYRIIVDEGSDPIVGTFGGLPEGGLVTADYGATGWVFSADYRSDEVVLTTVAEVPAPEPPAVWLLAAAAAMGAAGRLRGAARKRP